MAQRVFVAAAEREEERQRQYAERMSGRQRLYVPLPTVTHRLSLQISTSRRASNFTNYF